MGQKKPATILVIIFVVSLAIANQVSADWHVGNKRLSAYGVKANIWAPSTPIFLAQSGISNSVTLPLPYWMQTGWHYYQGYTNPKSYIEYCKPPCLTPSDYFQQDFSDHFWGSIKEYKVSHSSGTNWCASVAGIEIICQSILSAPTDMLVQSEVHVNSDNELNTTYTNVYYKTSNDQWLVFDQANWFESPPYLIHNQPPYTQYYFHVYRGSQISLLFLPIVIK